MDQKTIQILFALLRCAIGGTKLTEQELKLYSSEQLQELMKISTKHDVAHLLVLGLKQNGLIPKDNKDMEKCILSAVYRYERLKYEYENLCNALEKAQIPFLPLKGSVIRNYYPQAWMRTSGDIDVLVHREDLDKAVLYLTENLKYIEKQRATHDVSLFSPIGIHVEIHFDLVEEGRANNAIEILRSVWENAAPHENSEYLYEMDDAFFYFYHVAHMAKHFETGGCGIRPFIDLWILDCMDGINNTKRDILLNKGGLLRFTASSRKLSRIWLGNETMDDLSMQMQSFILQGGVYGSSDNRVALQQKKKGGRFGYILSRVFIPYSKLKRYYPILEKNPWLMPVMQVRRWLMLFNPDVAKMARREISLNGSIDKSKVHEMNSFLQNVGL